MRTICKEFGIDVGHRVMRHESQCANVHGHRYRVLVYVQATELDDVGRVVDFGVVKQLVGGWLLRELDHGYLHHPDDDVGALLRQRGMKVRAMPADLGEPTAENIATLVLREAQVLLWEKGLHVPRVVVWETPTSSAEATAP